MEYWEKNAPLGSRFKHRTDGTTYRVKNYVVPSYPHGYGLSRLHHRPYLILELETEEEGERFERRLAGLLFLWEFYTRLPYDDV